jgi:hypothetical protein
VVEVQPDFKALNLAQWRLRVLQPFVMTFQAISAPMLAVDEVAG